MKKWMNLFLCSALALGISLSSAIPSAEANAQATSETQVAALSVSDVINNSIAKTKKIKSYAVEYDLKQNMSMTVAGKTEKQNVTAKIKMNVIQSPIQVYQETNMSIPGIMEPQLIKQYFNEKQGGYAFAMGQWAKMPATDTKDYLSTIKSAGPHTELEKLKPMIKSTKLTTKGNDYVLTTNVKGEEMKKLAEAILSQSGAISGGSSDVADMLKALNIQEVSTQILVNKTTMYPTSGSAKVVMSIEQAGQKISMAINVTMKYSNYDKVKPIVIPQEALKSAK